MTRARVPSPVLALAIGAASGALAWGAAALLGFGAPLVLWVLGGALIGLVLWTVRHVLPAVEDDGVEEPTAPVDPWPSGVDVRTRVLESRLRGALQGRPATADLLHQTIVTIASERDTPETRSRALHSYLNAQPRTLTRAELRTILRELIAREDT